MISIFSLYFFRPKIFDTFVFLELIRLIFMEDNFYGLNIATRVVTFVDSESDHETEQRAKVVIFLDEDLE